MTFQSPSATFENAPARNSKLAIGGMVLAILGLVLCPTILLALIALPLSIAALVRINRRPGELSGKGFALTGLITSIVSLLIGPLVLLVFAGPALIMMPALGRSRELSNRSYCAANLRGIVMSMNIYAADSNDIFPVLQPAAPGAYLSAGPGTPGSANAEATIESIYKSGPGGDVLQAQWLLVLRSQVSTKQYICKSDTFATVPAVSTNPSGTFNTNFQGGNQVSYSFAFPYTSKNEVGKWWTALTDSSLPVASDIAPKHGDSFRGVTADTTILTPGTDKRMPFNAPNHDFEGQNVAYSDGHAEWVRSPTIGQNDDNIWTIGQTSAGFPYPAIGRALDGSGRVPAMIDSTTAPFDIVMVPVRSNIGDVR